MKTRISLITLALLVVLYLLGADWLIKQLAQAKLSESAGAQVDIAKVEHKLFPLQINFYDVQVTDNALPSRNKAQVKHVFADLEFLPLLKQQVVLRNLKVEDLALHTPRAQPGEVTRAPDPNSPLALLTQQELPSVDELLANSPLQTTQAIELAESDISTYKESLQSAYTNLVDEQRIERLKQDLNAFKQRDFSDPAALAENKQAFDALRNKLQAERDEVKQFLALAQAAKNSLQKHRQSLKQASNADYQLLKATLSGEQGAIEQITRSLFGDKAELYSSLILDLIAQLKQPVSANEGTAAPLVWIKEADISLRYQNKSLLSQWQNITNQHDVLGVATQYAMQTQASDLWQRFAVNGKFEIIDQLVSAANEWDIRGLSLIAVELLPEDAQHTLSAIIESGMLDALGSLVIKDNKLQGNARFDFSKLDINASGQSKLSQEVAAILQGISELDLRTDFGGTVNAPDIRLSSGLDRIIASALLNRFSSAQEGPLAELRQKLDAKIATSLKLQEDQISAVNALLDGAQGKDQVLENLLKQQVQSQIDKQKSKLLQKLSDKLFKG